MTLDGLESCLRAAFPRYMWDNHNHKQWCPKVNLPRFADDFIITGATKGPPYGYGDYREEIFSWLGWALQGIAVLVVDVRGQGESSDKATYEGNRVRDT